MSNSLWNLHVVAVPEADSDFDTVTEWAAEEIETLRAKVAELEGERDRHKQNEQLQMERAIAAEAQLAALPKWAQSSESKGQFYRKSIQEMAALREQLTALRDGLEGLSQYSWSVSGMVTAYYDPSYVRFDQIQSLLTQTTPTVNSAEAVGYPAANVKTVPFRDILKFKKADDGVEREN